MPILAAVLGWVTGILVNYLADVLPLKRRLVAPFCPACDRRFTLFPYLLRRRCAGCGQPRPWRTWLVELLFIGAALWLAFSPPPRLGFWVGLVWLAYFGVVVLIDLEYKLIMHPVSLFGAALGLATGIWLHGLWPTLLGGLVGFGVMGAFYLLGIGFMRLVARWRGQVEDDVALGFGDVNLSGVLGLLLGWPGITLGLFIAIMLGGLVGLGYMAWMFVRRNYRLLVAMPYGPFLIAGAFIALYLLAGRQ
jgi:leader peptidase (prepilin peptidase)/N-methyltransferase